MRPNIKREKVCKRCGTIFTTKRKDGNTLGKKQFASMLYCSKSCRAKDLGISKEHHAKMIAGRLAKSGYPSGKDCHFYIDGRCDDLKYVNWLKNKRNRLKKATIKEVGSHTVNEWKHLKKEYNYTCPCCGLSEPEIKLTEDHIKPLSKDGTDLIINIQPLCLSCNISKSNRFVKY